MIKLVTNKKQAVTVLVLGFLFMLLQLDARPFAYVDTLAPVLSLIHS